MLYLNGAEVESILGMETCIELMRETLITLAHGEAKQPLRQAERIHNGNVLGLMPGMLNPAKVVGAKIITVFPGNHQHHLPSHQGVVLDFDTENGALRGIVDGISITAIRTAAVSAVATDLLAKKSAHHLALLGAGTQARTHLEAMLLVREITQVTVWDYYPESAKAFAAEMAEQYGIPIKPCATVAEAVANADLICTVTLAQEPILDTKWLNPGVHINAVGACAPHARELATDVIVNAKLYVDRRESTINEAGCYLIPLAEGKITQDHIVGEIGDLLLGKSRGRANKQEITVFKALGIAVEDLAAAHYVLEEAKQRGVGTFLK